MRKINEFIDKRCFIILAAVFIIISIPAPGASAGVASAEKKKQGKFQYEKHKGPEILPAASEKQLKIDLGGVTFEMVRIAAGTFRMGNNNESDDEKPVHMVNITKPFYLGKYEVTQGQWKKIMGNNPSFFQPGQNGIPAGTDTQLYPVEQVSWNECREFIDKLNAMNKAGGTFRLPTEAEWEYSCRAGTNTKYFWGEQMDPKYCCFDENSNGTSRRISDNPNGFGLCDMSGNVWEWCEDSCNYDNGKIITDTYVAGITDPLCKTGSYRIFRGGSWYYDAGRSRSSIRDFGVASISNNSLGFRLCMSTDQ